MKTKLLTLAVLGAAVMLAGCEETDRASAKLRDPEVVSIGTFDDCEVKYVNRGWKDQSFYLARCGSTVAHTVHWEERSGKTTIQRQSIAITQEIEKLQAEKAVVEAKEQALAKLTPAERKALGVRE